MCLLPGHFTAACDSPSACQVVTANGRPCARASHWTDNDLKLPSTGRNASRVAMSAESARDSHHVRCDPLPRRSQPHSLQIPGGPSDRAPCSTTNPKPVRNQSSGYHFAMPYIVADHEHMIHRDHSSPVTLGRNLRHSRRTRYIGVELQLQRMALLAVSESDQARRKALALLLFARLSSTDCYSLISSRWASVPLIHPSSARSHYHSQLQHPCLPSLSTSAFLPQAPSSPDSAPVASLSIPCSPQVGTEAR